MKIALIGYGCYQFWFATNKLGDHGIYVQGISLIYMLFGFLAARIGPTMFSDQWRPDQPVEGTGRFRAGDTLRRLTISRF